MYSIGTKISWITVLNGKIVKAFGEVQEIMGEDMKVKGETVLGESIIDTLMTYDKSVNIEKPAFPVGTKVRTTDGDGTIVEFRPGVFPYFVRLDNGGEAWQGLSHIISPI